jgi:hypothetical protein
MTQYITSLLTPNTRFRSAFSIHPFTYRQGSKSDFEEISKLPRE